MEVATLGGGCFWCLEAVYQELKGVTRVRSGYSGGTVSHPSYEEVCSGATGHAEVVRVEFDPSVIAFREILEVFFAVHDPTTLNRQGNDVGTQYRSVIFFQTPRQAEVAREVMGEVEAQDVWGDSLVTELVPFQEMYPAEAHHEDYFRRNPGQSYCRLVIGPKVAELRKRFAQKLRGGGAPLV